MGANSAIEWTDATWNPLAGCTWASPGCDRCYAAVMARRLEAMARADIESGRDPGRKAKYIGITNKNKVGRIMFNGKVNLDETALSEPLTWKKPRRVFVNSMSDLFHKDVPDEFIDRVFCTMAVASEHTFQVLTKRSERAAQFVNKHWPNLAHFPNIWLGTSVENQAAADERIPHLLEVPARVRFLSCEPLLGPISFRPRAETTADMLRLMETGEASEPVMLKGIHWVICGGESGPGARPMQPDWARSLRDQCQAAGVSYFFKQWGEWLPFSHGGHGEPKHSYTDNRNGLGPSAASTHRVGKHAAGRLLDGREWSEFPEVLR